ncbi:pyridoxamine 5'-phosphate oxidase family protein [Hymenobacter sp. 15J16-1T3B]|uniref:pyridoxamine 5'-phosphate oxidase family protein n=1 Tax=Hymenobacter sp. 15J16-1T3B TaxID=2886941 RepID=UPI001D11DD4B|nr:pyridoxamine 5'-phosphate oxidase family protein [Hymenobacter sp. 15J16-1T3B]MCC3159764.1 pyridoxamine 5'-phosphate oxidase family protein [Hymenobacter sp. 15J16-1T3B]
MKPIPYHPGEVAVQEQADTRHQAAHLAQILQTELPPQAQAFLSAQPLLVLGSTDAQGQLWASVLTGPPGFLQVPEPHTLLVRAQPAAGDVLAANLAHDAAVGMTVVDFERRRRIRLNGRARLSAEGLTVALAEVFFNCPKYIQAREWQALPTPAAPAQAGPVAATLTPEQRAWIAAADTFFLATAHASAGADVSHRGGQPGFVRVLDAGTLEWPDYSGNGMFQSLGNLALDARAGLLFPDFAAGHVLQLTGQARTDWSPAHARRYPGAERVLTFAVAQVRPLYHALPFRWVFDGYSPFNPPVAEPPGAGA